MAFPTVVARTSSEQTSDADSFTVGLGSPSAGELIVAIIGADAATAATNILSWVVDEAVSGHQWWIVSKVLSNNAVVGLVVVKVAEGGDALKISFGDGSPQQASAITFRISGHGGYVSVASAIGSSTNGDPPNVAITGAAQDCLFIAALCTDQQVVATVAPTGYSNLTTKAATNLTGGASVSVADKTANATSDNPSTFTNTTEQWVAFSIAIPENSITTVARSTQVATEALSRNDLHLIATQVAVESVATNALNLIATQVAAEALSPNVVYLFATQVAIETLSADPAITSGANKYRQIHIAC